MILSEEGTRRGVLALMSGLSLGVIDGALAKKKKKGKGKKKKRKKQLPAHASVSGVGTTVSSKFNLRAGRYRASASMYVPDFSSGFILHLHGPHGNEEFVFNELLFGPTSWSAQAITVVETSGQHFVEVSNTELPWAVRFDLF